MTLIAHAIQKKVPKAVKVSREAQNGCGEAFYSEEVVECWQHLTCIGCSLGCFKNDTLSKKILQYQYAPLRGVYKPDPKAFFCRTSLEGQTT